jgi:micrococcal nuclease
MRRLPRFTLLAIALLCLAGCEEMWIPYDVGKERGDQSPQAIDGDTFLSGYRKDEPWRLARIDTPELPGHCRPGRKCVDGDPIVAKAVLEALLEDAPIKCKLVDVDVYKRNIGECYTASGKNISNEMLRLGVAERYER